MQVNINKTNNTKGVSTITIIKNILKIYLDEYL